MVNVRTALVGGLVATVLVAACGGGGGSKSTTTTKAPKPAHSTTTTTTTTTKTSATSGGSGSTGTKSGAKIRVLDLAVQNGAGVSIDVYSGYSALGAAKPLATVAYGTASAYFDPPKSGQDTTLSFYFHGKKDDASKLIDQSGTFGPTDRLTYAVWYGADAGGSGSTPSGHIQTIYEAAAAGPNAASNLPKVPDQKTVIEVFSSQTGTLGRDLAFDLGLPVGGCLPQLLPDGSSGGSDTRSLIGGTNLVDYVTDPGPQQVSLFTSSSGNCAAPPAAGPTDIAPTVGGVTLLVVYGTSASAIKLLALPVGS